MTDDRLSNIEQILDSIEARLGPRSPADRHAALSRSIEGLQHTVAIRGGVPESAIAELDRLRRRLYDDRETVAQVIDDLELAVFSLIHTVPSLRRLYAEFTDQEYRYLASVRLEHLRSEGTLRALTDDERLEINRLSDESGTVPQRHAEETDE